MAPERQTSGPTGNPAARDGESLAASAGERVRSILEAAEASAAEIRRDAETEASEHVRRVAEATSAMLERLSAMQAELDGLVGSLETVRSLAGTPSAMAPALEPEPEPTSDLEPPTGPADAGLDEELDGARLIALNMALNGSPREETARYLDTTFALADADGLLDEVYASVED